MYLTPTSKNEINNIIKNLENKHSYRYDQISNTLLKELRPVITNPLSIIYKKCLSEGILPMSMKQSDTILLFKAKCMYNCNNYRPISLLITLSKVLEKLVYKRTIDFLDKHNILYSSQYGFVKKTAVMQ